MIHSLRTGETGIAVKKRDRLTERHFKKRIIMPEKIAKAIDKCLTICYNCLK